VSTGEDLTSVTLAQIILENERNRRATLPTAFLHQLIKNGEAWQEFVQKSLKSSLEGIMTSQREADRVMREWASRVGWLGWPAPAAKPEKRGDVSEADALRDEVAALREQLRALEERLEKKREG
jgi:polyhydroxyalkanoate synthesis regulator protein